MNYDIINLGTKTDAEYDKQRYLTYATTQNSHCTRATFSVALICVIILVLVEISMTPDMKRNFIQVMVMGSSYIIISGFYQSRIPTTPYFYPATYQYHEILLHYNILDTKIHQRSKYCDMEFEVEDEYHHRSHKFIYNFAKEVKTDISQPLIDMKNKIIYIPS